MTTWRIAAFVAVGLSLAGNVGVVQRKRWGMGVWIVANLIWISYYLQHEDWPSLTLFTAYLGLAIWGFVRWSKAAPA